MNGQQDNIYFAGTDSLETLMTFNTYYEIQQVMVLGNLLGRASVNTDQNYITQGSGSMRLEVSGDYNSVNAYPFFSINCQKSSVSTKNFSAFEYISFDVFNDTDETLHIMIHLSVYGYSAKVEDTNTQTVTLLPGVWTMAKYDLQDGSVRKGFNNLQNVAAVVVEFPEYRTSEFDGVNIFYFDNFAGKRVSSPVTYNPARETNELLYFENSGDINYFNTDAYRLNIIYNAQLSINTNTSFVSQGTKSMKCVFKDRYIYYDVYVQSKEDFWIPLKLNIGAFSTSYKRITFDIFNGSGGERTIQVKHSYKRLFGTETFSTQTINIPNGQKVSVEVIAQLSSSTLKSLEISSNPANGADDVYYIDNMKAYTS
jgi:hypothetical protein